MTKEDLIAMAREADLWLTSDERIAAVQRFAKLIKARTREECAKAIQALPARHPENDGWGDEGGFAIMEPSEPGDDEWVEKDVAVAAIRAMGERT